MLTIYPGVTDDHCAFWQLEFRNLCLHLFICKSNLFNGNDLIPVAIGMDKGPEAYIAHHPTGCEVNNSFVEFVLERY
jgi:hypothetical protein